MRTILIGSILALSMASTSAIAQSAAAGRHGAAADSGQERMHRHRNNGQDNRQAERAPRTPTNSASTYGAGSVYTDRYHSSGAVTAGGRARGTGSQASSSSIDAYGSTDRNGSTGEVYGDSSATSNPAP